MPFNRRYVGVALLALSVVYDGFALSGRFHPMWLRMRARGGVEHLVAGVLGSLSFKALFLIAGAVLGFWPANKRS